MKQFICGLIWDLSEWTGISIGRLTPWVFGGMIGKKGKKVS